MREVYLNNDQLPTENIAHARLADLMFFPKDAGRNLASLKKCLEETTEPTRISTTCAGRKSVFFVAMCEMIEEVAKTNPAIEYVSYRDN